MLRKIVDYKKLDYELALLLIESYPDGYGDDDIVVFKNLHGDTVEAVEIKTEDTVYLVKISKSLSEFISSFDDTIEKELEARPQTVQTDSPEYGLDSDMDYDFEEDMERGNPE